MSRRAPSRDIDEADLEVEGAEQAAAGSTAVAIAMKRAVEQMGVARVRRGPCAELNQVDGFDCQGCAWPDPDPAHRHTAEFCENGAKAVTEEATQRPGRAGVLRRATRSPSWRERTDYWLGQQGRITEPMVLRDGRAPTTSRSPGTTRSRMIARHAATAWLSPDEAVFYTSGQDLQRGGVRLPALRPRLRHQQPARLLQHVPRVDVAWRWPR